MTTYHLIRTHDADANLYTSYCGVKQHSNFQMTRALMPRYNCTKCSAKYYAEQLEASPSAYHLGPRLDLTEDERRWDYKSIYEIRNASEAVLGFIAIRNGWGKRWQVHAWESNASADDAERDEIPPPVMANAPLTYRTEPDAKRETGGSFEAKEHALLTLPLLIAQDKLPSYEKTQTEATAWAMRMRTRKAENEALRKRNADQRAEDMALIQEEFAVLCSGGTLTNRQQAALTKAAELLRITL